jgi:hypothetical protein
MAAARISEESPPLTPEKLAAGGALRDAIGVFLVNHHDCNFYEAELHKLKLKLKACEEESAVLRAKANTRTIPTEVPCHSTSPGKAENDKTFPRRTPDTVGHLS